MVGTLARAVKGIRLVTTMTPAQKNPAPLAVRR